MIFPLAALLVLFNGTPIRSYFAPVVRAGRVVAPLDPYVTKTGATIGYSGGMMVITRGDRFAQLPVAHHLAPSELNSTYVAVAPLLRTLGLRVTFDALQRVVDVRTPSSVLATPTPFNAAVPRVAPTAVFTPAPALTPQPIVSGKPMPRRTPLPAPQPT